MEKCSSEDDSDISDSEIDKYKETTYAQLQSGKMKVKHRCPFCPGKMKQDYPLKDLPQHATDIGAAKKRKAKVRTIHLGLAKYLQKDVASSSEETLQLAVYDPRTPRNEENKFVWPWTGILVNLPSAMKFEEFSRESENRLRAQFSQFRPLQVMILGNPKDQNCFATINFAEDLTGFNSASAFEMHFIEEKYGKADWNKINCRQDDLYGWLAKSNDYYSPGPIGEHLRKNGVLRSLGDLEREGRQKTSMLVSYLASQINEKNKQLEELELKKVKSAMKLRKMTEEKNQLVKEHNEKMIKMLQGEINQRCKQLEDLASNITERATLVAEIEEEKKLLDSAIKKQETENEKLCSLLEEQKLQEETDVTLRMLTALQVKLDDKHKLELEIEKLRGKLEVIKLSGAREDTNLSEELKKMSDELDSRNDDMDFIDTLIQGVIVREQRSSEEVEEAKKVMIRALLGRKSGRRYNTKIGVKRMGELDQRAFRDACKQKIGKDDFEVEFARLYSKWEHEIRQPEWYYDVDAKKETIQEDDEKLQALKAEFGEKAHDLVVRALREMNEYSPHERCPEPELWDLKKDRKATVPEVAAYLLEQWSASKSRRV